MTLVFQPLNQRIIKNIKHFYRRLLSENILTKNFTALKINLVAVQASRMCKQTWDLISRETIKNCLKKNKNKTDFVIKKAHSDSADETMIEDVSLVDGWEDVMTDRSS